MNTERKQGHYWVKYEGQWTVAEYSSYFKEWNLPGRFYTVKDKQLEINETLLSPPEDAQELKKPQDSY